MNKLLIFSLFLALAPLAAKCQTYLPITSTNKTFLATVKGISYTYKNGVVTVKNNGQYNIGELRISATSTVDKELYGVALFEDGLDKGQTLTTTVYFTRGLNNDREIPLKQIDQKKLEFSLDKATRAQ
ncbi:hypothetical protein [Chitinophaga qingshengii]|uniref:Uncharacterized protein n=1 Tax=Chitinophaga qingshengii TaxID=1569794 RepID=A0ABR7TT91_9BACT|nr:hypothetical protein [Chitinophaga qingshengii]MBC9932184.1 hypothetical protein [Chitinophaga qingshengii]